MVEKGDIKDCTGNKTIARQLNYWVFKQAENRSLLLPKEFVGEDDWNLLQPLIGTHGILSEFPARLGTQGDDQQDEEEEGVRRG